MTRRVQGDLLPRTAVSDAVAALVTHKTDAQLRSAPAPVFPAGACNSDTMPVAKARDVPRTMRRMLSWQAKVLPTIFGKTIHPSERTCLEPNLLSTTP